MRNIIFISFIMLFSFSLFSQDNGTITFERRTYWINIYSKLPWVTKDDVERDRLSWGKNDGDYAEKYDLIFKDNTSSYLKQESKDNQGYSWQEDEYYLMRDYTNKTVKDKITLLDKDYIITGDLPKYKWKILNEIKEIQGFLCMKAETTDPVKNTKITAWYTDKIKMRGGPEGLYGLPGMILAATFNEDDVIIEATVVSLKNDVAIATPKKMKGKEINIAEYNTKYAQYVKEQIEGKRNPYWSLRY